MTPEGTDCTNRAIMISGICQVEKVETTMAIIGAKDDEILSLFSWNYTCWCALLIALSSSSLN